MINYLFQEDNEVDDIDEEEDFAEVDAKYFHFFYSLISIYLPQDEETEEQYDPQLGNLNGEEFLMKEFSLSGQEAYQVGCKKKKKTPPLIDLLKIKKYLLDSN